MATTTALEAQKYQFGQIYAASVAKMHPNHRYIPTKEKYDIMLDALKNKVANSKDKKCHRYIKDYIVVTVAYLLRSICPHNKETVTLTFQQCQGCVMKMNCLT